MRRIGNAKANAKVNSKRITESAVPDGDEIRRLRIEQGYSITAFAKRTGFTQRTLGKCENLREPRQMFTLTVIAKALGCDVEQIILQPHEFRWALMQEVLESATGNVGREGGILARLIHGLEQLPDQGIAEAEILLALAVKRDVMGNSLGALRLGEQLVEESEAFTPELAVRIRIRTATFYDHAGRPEEGLALLHPVLKGLKGRNPRDWTGEEWWARYQRGVLLVKSHKLLDARRVLTKFLTTKDQDGAPRDDHQLAARHQLGVIDYLEDKLDDAESNFKQCEEARLALSKDDFRLVYEYRRLADIADKRGDTASADRYRRKAGSLVERWSLRRYTKELKTPSPVGRTHPKGTSRRKVRSKPVSR